MAVLIDQKRVEVCMVCSDRTSTYRPEARHGKADTVQVLSAAA